MARAGRCRRHPRVVRPTLDVVGQTDMCRFGPRIPYFPKNPMGTIGYLGPFIHSLAVMYKCILHIRQGAKFRDLVYCIEGVPSSTTVLLMYLEVLCFVGDCNEEHVCYLLFGTPRITSAPWKRKMPGRSACPKAAEAKAVRPGADRRRTCGSRGHFVGRYCLTAAATTDHSPNLAFVRRHNKSDPIDGRC
jgi:hypothetical protein